MFCADTLLFLLIVRSFSRCTLTIRCSLFHEKHLSKHLFDISMARAAHEKKLVCIIHSQSGIIFYVVKTLSRFFVLNANATMSIETRTTRRMEEEWIFLLFFSFWRLSCHPSICGSLTYLNDTNSREERARCDSFALATCNFLALVNRILLVSIQSFSSCLLGNADVCFPPSSTSK